MLRPRADLLERGFGFGEEDADDPGELVLGEIALRGRIDRIDVEPGGNAGRAARLQDLEGGARA